ncbi:MAG: alkaline phosphatase D family protein, partial [Pseudomonadota bacterium]
REALYKAWTWGGLLTLTALETRLMARTKQIEYTEIVPTLKGPDDIARFERDILQDPGRYLLGETQLAFVEKTIKGSVARQEPWRLIANQAMMAKVVAPNLKPYASEEMIADLEKEWDQARAFVEFSVLGLPLNLDAWDGYPAARELLYKRLKGQGATDLVVLTGDSHEFWANNLNDAQGNRMGVELGTSGVTSPGPSLYLKDKAFDYSLLLRRENEAVRYHNPLHNGYIHIVLKEDKGIADYISVDIAQSTQYQTASVARFTLAKKNGTVEFTQPRGLGIKERVLF